MKPRLSFRHGIWRCNRPGERNPAGFGYTAKSAFDEWLAECWRKPIGPHFVARTYAGY
jgi:hypothetical protein